MVVESEVWRSLDPDDSASVSLVTPAVENGGAGKVVLLEATEAALTDGWAARAAVALVRSWADRGAQVVLVDLNLDAPSLHEAVGEGGREEGIADVIVYGASIRRVSRPQANGAFYLITAGTPVPDPAPVLSHPRWNDVLRGFQEASVTFVALLPSGHSGGEALRASETDRILLSTEEEWHALRDQDGAGDRYTVALGPASTEASPDAASPTASSEIDPPPPEAGEADQAGERRSERGPAEGATPSVSGKAAPAVHPRKEGRKAPKPKDERKERRTSPWLLFLLFGVVAGILVGAWLGLLEIPGIDLFGFDPTPPEGRAAG